VRLARVAVLVGIVCALLAVLPAFADTPSLRYFEQTGHTVSGPFLAFLAAQGDPSLLGAPLSEATVQGTTVVQWFERGELQLNADLTTSLAPLPRALVPGPFPRAAAAAASQSPLVQYFPETGFSVGFAILDFYREHGGQAVFGPPVSPQIGNSQWFERARLDWDPVAQRVSLAPLGRDLMQLAGLNPDDFATQWVATFEPTKLLSAPAPDADGTDVPQFRSFLQVGSQGDYLKVWDPARNQYGWIAGSVVGPASAPSWLSGLANAEYVGLPGRIAKPLFGEFPDPAPELKHNAPVWITARLTGSDAVRYDLDDTGNAIPQSIVRLPRPPAQFLPGRWIDADLREPVMITAYEGNRAVYSALAVKGTGGHPTQIGTFAIWRRVANETMSSDTIGIPLGAPGSYHLTGVLFTQYFTHDGAALHYNYWKSSWGYAGSHGCLGMNYDDSKWFWDWATIGTPVVTRT